MTTESGFRPDVDRLGRIGLEEAVFCASKSAAQIEEIVWTARDIQRGLLLTRLTEDKFYQLQKDIQSIIHFDELSRTGIVGKRSMLDNAKQVAVVTAGTSDLPVAKEAERTLFYHGIDSDSFYDVGVAGLWRILSVEQELRKYRVVIIAAGMDAALPSVVGGLIPSVVIAVPTSVGYGVAEGGRSALESILSSCAPGITTVNVDNGYGAACAAIRVMNAYKSNAME